MCGLLGQSAARRGEAPAAWWELLPRLIGSLLILLAAAFNGAACSFCRTARGEWGWQNCGLLGPGTAGGGSFWKKLAELDGSEVCNSQLPCEIPAVTEERTPASKQLKRQIVLPALVAGVVPADYGH